MAQNTVYYLDSEEAVYVVEEIKHDFPAIDFKMLKRKDIMRFNTIGMSGVLHFDQSNFPEYSTLIWGSGSDHDTSLLMSPRRDFVKSVDDAHSDYAGKLSTLVTGVNECVHNSTLLQNYQHAKGVEVRGNLPVQEEQIICGPQNEQKFYFQHSGYSIYSYAHVDFPIHKSIDLDVVPDFPARYDWQNSTGTGLELDNLIFDLQEICKINNIIRFDIGGLHFPTPDEIKFYGDGKINPKKNPKNLSYAVSCYRSLLDVYLSHIPIMKKME